VGVERGREDGGRGPAPDRSAGLLEQAAPEVLGLAPERLAGEAQRGQIIGAQRPVDAMGEQGVLAERGGESRLDRLEQVAKRSMLTEIAFDLHASHLRLDFSPFTRC
jgi:hypothetical protein